MLYLRKVLEGVWGMLTRQAMRIAIVLIHHGRGRHVLIIREVGGRKYAGYIDYNRLCEESLGNERPVASII